MAAHTPPVLFGGKTVCVPVHPACLCHSYRAFGAAHCTLHGRCGTMRVCPRTAMPALLTNRCRVRRQLDARALPPDCRSQSGLLQPQGYGSGPAEAFVRPDGSHSSTHRQLLHRSCVVLLQHAAHRRQLGLQVPSCAWHAARQAGDGRTAVQGDGVTVQPELGRVRASTAGSRLRFVPVGSVPVALPLWAAARARQRLWACTRAHSQQCRPHSPSAPSQLRAPAAAPPVGMCCTRGRAME